MKRWIEFDVRYMSCTVHVYQTQFILNENTTEYTCTVCTCILYCLYMYVLNKMHVKTSWQIFLTDHDKSLCLLFSLFNLFPGGLKHSLNLTLTQWRGSIRGIKSTMSIINEQCILIYTQHNNNYTMHIYIVHVHVPHAHVQCTYIKM